MPKFFADEAITVADTAIGATAATIADSTRGAANYAIFGPLATAPVRYRFDAVPEAATGALLEVGDTLICRGAEVSQVRFIRTGSTSGVLFAQYGIEG